MRLNDLKEEYPDLFWVTRAGYELVLPKLEKMTRKALKLGRPMPEVTIEQEAIVGKMVRAGSYTREVQIAYVGLILRSEPIVLNGWKFIAVVQHVETGNILHRPFGDRETDIPLRYRSTTTELCEHCHTRRKRNDTYLVWHIKNNDWKQVGKTCLRDHCGGHDPSDALFAADAPRRIQAWFGEHEAQEKYIALVSTREFVIDCIVAGRRMGGFVTAKAAKESGRTPTAGIVWDAHQSCAPSSMAVYKMLSDNRTEADILFAGAALAWAQGLSTDVGNEYLSNLRTACTRDITIARNINLVASVIPAYQRELEYRAEREAEARAAASTTSYVGSYNKGQRYDFGKVRFLSAKSFESDYGTKYVLKFVTADGRKLVWFTGSSMRSVRYGAEVYLDGKFVKVSTFRGQDEIHLNYCRWREVEEAVADAAMRY